MSDEEIDIAALEKRMDGAMQRAPDRVRLAAHRARVGLDARPGDGRGLRQRRCRSTSSAPSPCPSRGWCWSTSGTRRWSTRSTRRSATPGSGSTRRWTGRSCACRSPSSTRSGGASSPRSPASTPSRPGWRCSNVRRDGMDQLKKARAAGMAEDDEKLWHDEIQELTDAVDPQGRCGVDHQARRDHADLTPVRADRSGTRVELIAMYMNEASIDVPGPTHVAIIMDGNGRWATSRGLPRLAGHKRGADRVREIVESCPDLGITHLTLFAFSTENWNRPDVEVIGLMRLFRRYIKKEGARLVAEGVRVRFIGGRERLARDLQALMGGLEAQTADNDRLHLTVAINYGGRDEILRATRRVAEAVRAGTLRADEIGPATIEAHLDTAGPARPRPHPAHLGRVPRLGLPALAVGLCGVRLRRHPLAGLHRRDVRRAGAWLRPPRATVRRRGAMTGAAPRPVRFADLGLRLASGLVLAAIALLQLWAGGAWAAAFLALVLVLMLWEYHRMVTGSDAIAAPSLVVPAVAGVLSLVATAIWGPPIGLPCLVVAALLVAARRAAVVGVADGGLRLHDGGDGRAPRLPQPRARGGAPHPLAGGGGGGGRRRRLLRRPAGRRRQALAGGQPRQDLVRRPRRARGRRPRRLLLRLARGRLAPAPHRAPQPRHRRLLAVRRPARVGGQAAVRGEGREPADPGARRGDGPARRGDGRGLVLRHRRQPRHRHATGAEVARRRISIFGVDRVGRPADGRADRRGRRARRPSRWWR